MKIYTKEYGWVRATFRQWVRWLLLCLWEGHYWRTLGDPCKCGSDNCFYCRGCGYETHD